MPGKGNQKYIDVVIWYFIGVSETNLHLGAGVSGTVEEHFKYVILPQHTCSTTLIIGQARPHKHAVDDDRGSIRRGALRLLVNKFGTL